MGNQCPGSGCFEERYQQLADDTSIRNARLEASGGARTANGEYRLPGEGGGSRGTRHTRAEEGPKDRRNKFGSRKGADRDAMSLRIQKSWRGYRARRDLEGARMAADPAAVAFARHRPPPPAPSCCQRLCARLLTLTRMLLVCAIIGALVWYLGPVNSTVLFVFLLMILFALRERFLGMLVGWVMFKTPKKFRWSFERIAVRPSVSRFTWSELTLINWTWWNPDGFDDGDERLWLLQIDRLTIRLSFRSVYYAVRYKHSIEIDFILAEGVRFHTQRNKAGALNLWAALDIPDDDVNVKAFVQQAQTMGGLDGARVDTGSEALQDSAQGMQALPPVSTKRTREAAKFWRPEWGTTRTASNGDIEEALLPAPLPKNLPKGYKEYPIGDPRRRPRWGVPFRLDIRQLVGLDVELWILDFLLLDAHRTRTESEDVKLTIHNIDITRERLERADPRRSGSDDNIHGVYLGELIFTIIAEAIPYILRESKTRLLQTILNTALYGAKDAGLLAGARAFELFSTAKQKLQDAGRKKNWTDYDCRVEAHLIKGRHFASADGHRINVGARFELRSPPDKRNELTVIDTADSTTMMWTKNPRWDQKFVLGPVEFKFSTLRVTVFSRKTAQVMRIGGREPEMMLGEVILPLSALLIEDVTVSREGEKVGWFPLQNASETSRRGVDPEVKLGFRLVNAARLPDYHDDVDYAGPDFTPAWSAAALGGHSDEEDEAEDA